MNLLNILLMAAPQAEGGKSSGFQQIILLVGIIVIFYFFMIRPQTKRNKEARKFRDNLQKGQKIVTIGGVHGKIVEVNETTVIIESEGSRLKLAKSAIASSEAEQIEQK